MPATERLRELATRITVHGHFSNSPHAVSETRLLPMWIAHLQIFENAGHQFSRSQLLVVFKALNDLGCGEFKVGRRGWPSRFEWSSGIISVGRAAIGEQENVEQIEGTPEEEVDTETDWLTHTFHLRRTSRWI